MSNSKRSTGRNPLGYMGVEATTPSQLIQNTIPPTSEFNQFNIGTTWINTDTDQVWFLTNLNGGSATWTEVGIEALTINADTGSAVETGGAVSIIGSGVLTTSGATDTLTLGMTADTDGQLIIGSTAGLPDWGNIISTGGTIVITEGANSIDLDITAGAQGARLFNTDVGVATAAGVNITIAGGTNINTSGAGSTVTINLDDPIIVADIITDDIQVTNLGLGVVQSDATGVLSSSAGTDGQLYIGATGTDAAWANLTSISGSIIITEGANTLNVESEAGLGGRYLFVLRTLDNALLVDSRVTDVSPFGTTVWVAACGPGSDTFSKIMTSTDGITWARSFFGSGDPADGCTAVHCGSNGTNVAALGSGKVVVSTDPTAAWTRYNTTDLQAVEDIWFDGTYWVTAGGNNKIRYETDPTSGAWTANAVGITENLKGCVFGNNTWVVVGDNGYIGYQTTDPTGAFTGVAAAASGFDETLTGNSINVEGVAYSPALGLFCAVGTEARAATSPDGITWTPRILDASIATTFHEVVWDSVNTLFVAHGSGILNYSANGIIWHRDEGLGLSSLTDGMGVLDGNVVVFNGNADLKYNISR